MEGLAYGDKAWETIQKEFGQVRGTYLDHAGATLYSPAQVQAVSSDLCGNLYGNPHSRSASSKLTSDLVDQIRAQILHFFGASSNEYSLVFTSGTTGSLKLVAESFVFTCLPHSAKSSFVYLKESHTSVVGMRECFKDKIPCYALPTSEVEKYVIGQELLNKNTTDVSYKSTRNSAHIGEQDDSSKSNSLFVFPAQCNFSGSRYPLEWIAAAQNGQFSQLNPEFCINSDKISKEYINENESDWYCLLDAASFVGTNRLDLSVWKPDFVAISFYKIFGYPTGVGALIVHERAHHTLKKTYFGGGTVEMFSSSRDIYTPRQLLHEKFEDGTANFLAILSIKHGLNFIRNHLDSMENVSVHTFHVAQWLFNSLTELKHANGRDLVEIYCNSNFTDRSRQGAIVTFNLKDENGCYIGYAQVEKILALHDIHVRTGCFCNPAACQRYLRLTEEESLSQFMSGHKCGDEMDLINGRPTGAVRVSLGYMTRKSDVLRLVEVIRNCFLNEGRNAAKKVDLKSEASSHGKMELVGIHIYPIKSCGAFSPQRWPVSRAGLLYDRKWVIVNAAGAALTQKREPRLCLIQPEIDLERKLLHLKHRQFKTSVSVSLESGKLSSTEDIEPTEMCFTKICGTVMKVTECSSEVNEWLQEVLDQPGLKLLRYEDSSEKLSLANDSPFLLINRNSILTLQHQSVRETDQALKSIENYLARFRGNLIVDGPQPFDEESWTEVKIGPFSFKNVGSCHRCQMICIDQQTATRNQEPLATLASSRGKKVPFGILLELCSSSNESNSVIEVGYPITPNSDL